jgi:hypothetical protein
MANVAAGATPLESLNNYVNFVKLMANWTAALEAIADTRVRSSDMTAGSTNYGSAAAGQYPVSFSLGYFAVGDLVYVSDGTRGWVCPVEYEGELNLKEEYRIRGATLADYTTITLGNLTAKRIGIVGLGNAPEIQFSRVVVVNTAASTVIPFKEDVRQHFKVTSVRLTSPDILAENFVVHVQGASETPDLTATLTAGSLTEVTTFANSNEFEVTDTTGIWQVKVIGDGNASTLVSVAIHGEWMVVA